MYVSLTKKWFVWPLFLLFFVYAVLRAWKLEPILDELATFYSYIRTGHYFNTIELLDANNHVLNSFLGHQFYRLFGDQFFLFRLASLVALPVYFFSLRFIVQKTIPSKWQVLVFLGLICIPWVFEYFSYSRGYATAIACFFASIALSIRWNETKNTRDFGLIFIFLFLTIASSLTYLMPSMLLFLLVGLVFLLNVKQLKKKVLVYVGIVVAWLVAITPFVRYSFELKEAGALWWGNQNGLWESTGKSLSRLVVFTEASWMFYVVCFLLLFCTVVFLLNWKEKGFWLYLKENDALLFLLLMGALIGVVVMRYLFDVNYPMDRVGMFLVPLFLLNIGVFLSKHAVSRYALLVFVFFPVSFLFHVNLSTSIFSPEDRIPTYLSNEIKSRLSDQTALSAEHVSHMSYAYSCRNDEEVHMAYSDENVAHLAGDYHINWLGIDRLEGYSIFAQDPESRTTVFKREKAFQRELIFDTLVRNASTQDMYYTVFRKEIDSFLRSGSVQVALSGKLRFDKPTLSFNLVRSVEDKNGVRTSDSSPIFNWYFGERKDVRFTFVDGSFDLTEKDHAISLFLFNNDLCKIDIDSLRIRIFHVR